MGVLLRWCAGFTRLGRAGAVAGALLFLLAGAGEAAGYLAVAAVGLHFGVVLLDPTGERHTGPTAGQPGLGSFAYRVQQVLGLAVAFWVSTEMGADSRSAAADVVNDVITTGLVYAGAGTLAVLTVLVANPLRSRAHVLRRAAPLLAPMAGGLLVFIGLGQGLPAMQRWHEAQPETELAVESIVALLGFCLFGLAVVGALAGYWGILLYGAVRFGAQRYHPVLPPIMDLWVASAGVATIVVNLAIGADGGLRYLEEAVGVALLVAFAVADLRIQQRRRIRPRPTRRASPTRAPRHPLNQPSAEDHLPR